MGVVWDKAMYDRAYSIEIRDPDSPLCSQQIGYGRIYAQKCTKPENDAFSEYEERAELLTSVVPHGARVLVAGCGFGYLMEALRAHGRPSIGADRSDWVAEAWHHQRPNRFMAPPLHVDIRAKAVERDYDVVVTESMVESYPDDGERAAILRRCHSLAPKVVHMVYDAPELVEPLVAMSLEDWAAQDPEATWISIPQRCIHD